MRWDYPLLDINPVFAGLGVIIIIIIIIIITITINIRPTVSWIPYKSKDAKEMPMLEASFVILCLPG